MRWIEVCEVEDIIPYTGVAALINGEQIAIFRLGECLFAISNYDPFSRAYVLARGIVGDRGGVIKVASPIYKHSFDLMTGQCLDDPSVSIPVYPLEIVNGIVRVGVQSSLKG